MVDFAKLKSMSGSKSLEKLTAELNKLSGAQAEKKGDDRFWYPNVDKAGNGYAVIRFLPAPGDEDVPFVRVFSHGFKGPTGSWLIENCSTTLGHKCPVCEANSELWNSGIDSDKEVARERKRKLAFISNIFVITDTANPENEGKVFLFKYGKKLFDKLNDAMNPQFPDQDPMNPFDLWSGANFKLKIRNVEGYRNYDKSEFAAPGPLSDDDAQMEAVYNKAFFLQEFMAPYNFKSYDEMKSKFMKVLGLDHSVTNPEVLLPGEDENEPWKTAAPAPKFKTAEAPKQSAVEDDDDDEGLEFFKRLTA